MQAARALRLVGRGGHRLELQDGSESNDDDDSSSSSNNGASTASQRREVWNMHPMLEQRQETVTTTPLQLVAQLRRDYAAFSEEVYGSPPSMSSIEDFRARRQRERLQLDSLHARLHGLRLILAMARTRLLRARLLRARARTLLSPSNPIQSAHVPKPNPVATLTPHPTTPPSPPPPLGAELQVAAETEMERVEFFGGDDSDDPSGVFLVSMAPRRAPDPVGVPAKKIDEIMPELEASAADVEVTCSICICELEEGETIRCMPNCSHKFHSKCIDRWFERSVACPNCKAPVCEVEAPPPEEQGSPLSVFSRLTPNISISSTLGSITGPVILPGRVAAPRRPPESAPSVSVNGNLLHTTSAPAYDVQAAMAASPLLSERLSAITPSPAAIAATAAAAAATTAAAAVVTTAAAASRPASPAATAAPVAVRALAALPSAMLSGISGSAPLTGMAAARASGIAAAAAARAREEAAAAARAAAEEATTATATAAAATTTTNMMTTTTTTTTSTGASTSATTTAPTPSALSSSAASATTTGATVSYTVSGPATAVPASAATAPNSATVSTATTRAIGAAASSVRTASPSATRAAATRTAPTRAAVTPAASSATAAATAVSVAA